MAEELNKGGSQQLCAKQWEIKVNLRGVPVGAGGSCHDDVILVVRLLPRGGVAVMVMTVGVGRGSGKPGRVSVHVRNSREGDGLPGLCRTGGAGSLGPVVGPSSAATAASVGFSAEPCAAAVGVLHGRSPGRGGDEPPSVGHPVGGGAAPAVGLVVEGVHGGGGGHHGGGALAAGGGGRAGVAAAAAAAAAAGRGGAAVGEGGRPGVQNKTNMFFLSYIKILLLPGRLSVQP